MRNEFVSVEEEALKTFAAKRKADEIEKELHEFIVYTLGGEAWNELIALRGKIRKERQQAAREAELRARRNMEIAAIINSLPEAKRDFCAPSSLELSKMGSAM